MRMFWDKISYLVQLLAACLVFIAPVRKRKYFLLTTVLSSVTMAVFVYSINSIYYMSQSWIMPIIFWTIQLLICVGGVWLCIDGSFMQAVYCTVFACGTQHIAFDFYMVHQILGGTNVIVSVLCYIIVYVLFYIFVAKRLPERGAFASSRQAILPIATIIVVVLIFSVLEISDIAQIQATTFYRIMYRILDGICCVYVMWVQLNQKERISLQRELDGIHAAFEQQKKQYEITGETIDMINRKCHDLKYQIRAIREIPDEEAKREYFEEIENAIMIYDTALDTGNRALDIVLMEKGLYCKNHGIQWTCMADGRLLNFLRTDDIYVIFGNALDNAIRAVFELPDLEKRVISVKIITQGRLLVIQIQNYYHEKLKFEDHLPVTTKSNKKNHGYGLKSIRYTAEKYNGTITVFADEQIFYLQVFIPIPEKETIYE